MRPTDDEVRRELKRIATSPFLSEKEDTYSLLASSSQQNGTQGGIPLSSVGQAGQIQSMVTPSPLRRTRAKSSTLSRRKFTWQAGLVVCLGLAALVVIPAVLSNNDNQRYANVGSNIANPTISTTNLPKNNSLYTLVGSDQFISNISWSPDGKYIAATDGFNLFVWRSGATSPTPVYTPNVCDSTNYYLGPIAWSPDSSSIALNCNGHVRVWNMQKNEIVLTYSPNSHGSINDLVWSPDGKYIATASDYMAVDVWNVMTGHRSMTYTGHTNPITVVAWSPNGKYVASGGYDQEVKVWDPTNGHTLLTYTGHAEWITAISWSSDSSRIASSDVNGIIHVWNARDGSNVTTLNTLSRINSMEWSPDGKSIATGTADGILRIYNAASWKYATYIIWNSDTFRDGDNLGGMVWSPDSKEIAYPLAQTIQVMAV